MSKRRLILASASPRRQELLQDIGYPFDIVTADCEETFDYTASVFLLLNRLRWLRHALFGSSILKRWFLERIQWSVMKIK